MPFTFQEIVANGGSDGRFRVRIECDDREPTEEHAEARAGHLRVNGAGKRIEFENEMTIRISRV
jgi:hypothetical protein